MFEQEGLTSVVIQAESETKGLENSVNAILSQTAPVEILLVGDKKSETFSVNAKKIAGKDTRVRILALEEKTNFAKANNFAAKESKGEYLLFLKPGFVFPADTISFLKEEAQKEKGLCAFAVLLKDKSGREFSDSRVDILTPVKGFFEFSELADLFGQKRIWLNNMPLSVPKAEIEAVGGSFLFIPSIVFHELKGFGKDYSTEIAVMDLCIKIKRGNGKIFFFPSIATQGERGDYLKEAFFREKNGFKDTVLYFHENFGHAYPQPILWLIYSILWGRRFFENKVKKGKVR